MWRLILLYLILIKGAFANDVAIEQLRFITVNEPPANFLDQNQQLKGYVVDIVQQLQKQLEINSEIEVMPEARALRTLNTQPRIVMFSISRTPERENKYHWLAHVISKRWIFYSRSDSSLDIRDLEQIRGMNSIGVIQGDIRQKWLKAKNINSLVPILDYENAIEMLIKRRIDLLFFESYGAYSTVNKLGYAPNEIKAQYVANISDVYIVMSKFEGSSAVADELQKHLLLILKSEEQITRKKKWIDDLYKINKSGVWINQGILTY